MKVGLLICSIYLLFADVNFCQTGPDNSNDSLTFWSDVMFHSEIARFRQFASTKVDDIIFRLLSSQKLDTNSLPQNIVRLKLPNSNTELFSWQCELENNSFNYFCYVKFPNGRVIKLNREERNLNRIRNEEFDDHNWYGSIYYYIIPIKFGTDPYFVLFGFSQNSNKEKFKIIETLKFDGERIKLGVPVFKLSEESGDEEIFRRQVIKYSSNANCQLQFESKDSLIVYDHIIHYQNPNNPEVDNYYPDGSYEALNYSNGVWSYISKMSTESMPAAPRSKPVLDSKTKDLFGKDIKKRK